MVRTAIGAAGEMTNNRFNPSRGQRGFEIVSRSPRSGERVARIDIRPNVFE